VFPFGYNIWDAILPNYPILSDLTVGSVSGSATRILWVPANSDRTTWNWTFLTTFSLRSPDIRKKTGCSEWQKSIKNRKTGCS
jgi:hypothetical protein